MAMIMLDTVSRMVRKALSFYLFTSLPFYFFTFLSLYLFYSCGVDGDRFRIEGRLRNINQGQFWICSPDGGIDGIDTIQVRDGRFAYETELRTPATFIIVFPNFSEQPVFGKPGAKVTIKGDATHMKEMTVEGTDENESMTKLRMELNRQTPPEALKTVESYIEQNPKSIVSVNLLERFFIVDVGGDLRKASKLADVLAKAQPDNGRLIALQKQLTGIRNARKGDRLPAFTATDVRGRSVSQEQLKAPVNVVTVWATWSYSSTDIQRRLQKLKQEFGSRLNVVSICLDANPRDIRFRVERDSLPWPTVCDGRIWQCPLLQQLGVCDVPSNLLTDDRGIITDRDLQPAQLEEKIRKKLK